MLSPMVLLPVMDEITPRALRAPRLSAGQATIASSRSVSASASGAGPDALTPERQAQIVGVTEKQLRLIVLAIPHWRSRP